MQFVMTDVLLKNVYIKAGSEKFPEPSPRLQIESETPQPDGSKAIELLNVKVPIDVYQHCSMHVGKAMSISVIPYGKDGGGIGYYYPKTKVPLPVFKDVKVQG